jgi:release factor glutamine methyltransferase
MSDRVWTVKDILDTARRYLEEKGMENARGDAESLLGKALNLPRIELYLQHERPLSEGEVAVFRELLRRRGKREPLQLILGRLEFAGAQIEVLPGVLIPRPETEELTEYVISQLPNSALRILDIGTGSGCIAVALAKRLPAITVDAVDADFEAVRLTSRNAQANGVSERVRAILCDIFSPRVPTSIAPPYDVVVSNPPYVSKRDYETLAPEIRDHEPKHALVAGDDGLEFYRRLVELLPALLKDDGRFAIEIGAGQEDSVRALFTALNCELATHHDMAGVPRILSGIRHKER